MHGRERSYCRSLSLLRAKYVRPLQVATGTFGGRILEDRDWQLLFGKAQRARFGETFASKLTTRCWDLRRV